MPADTFRDLPPNADPLALLDAFLAAHASREAVPAVLFARGEDLYRRLAGDPPAVRAWGRFLVALGHLAAEILDDVPTASRYFLAALQGVDRHGDHEAAVTAGYDQGVIHERRGPAGGRHARAAYRAAAGEGFRLGVIAANTLRAGVGAVRLHVAEHGDLDDDTARLAKRTWLGWLWLRRHDPPQLDGELRSALGRTLAALLLPEDDPGELAARWRRWPPSDLTTADGPWRDGDPRCLEELFAAAAESADEHLRDEGDDPGGPYRVLWAAARRGRV